MGRRIDRNAKDNAGGIMSARCEVRGALGKTLKQVFDFKHARMCV